MSREASQRTGARELRERRAELCDRQPGAVPGGAAPVAAVAEAIHGWRPCTLGERAAAFAREVVATAAVPTPARARALLFAAARLAAFGEQAGLEPRAEVLLHPSVIERFVVEGCRSRSPATRRTLRTNLRYLARATRADPQPAPVPLPRERAKAPYGEAEIAGYLALAAAQSTVAKRMRASALVCLGAGAGLVGQELRHLRGSDVVERSGGLLVAVSGPRARAVPVLERFHAPLRTAAAFAGQRYLIGGSAPARRNLSDALSAALCQDAGLPRLEPGRLRSTWLCECARLIGLGAFMHAAGIRCSQRLGDLVAGLPGVQERAAVALLGGADGGADAARAP
jgi:integrase